MEDLTNLSEYFLAPLSRLVTPELSGALDYSYVSYHDSGAANRLTNLQPRGGILDLNVAPTHSILKNKQVYLINFIKFFRRMKLSQEV